MTMEDTKSAASSSTGKRARTEEEDPQKKKRRHGPVGVSCMECKRRKIRCDRGSPCGSCLRRSCPHLCIWEVEPSELDRLGPRQPNTMGPMVTEILGRLSRVEAILASSGLSADVESGRPSKHHRDRDLDSSANPSAPRESGSSEVDDSNTEDAVMALENATFGRTSAFGPCSFSREGAPAAFPAVPMKELRIRVELTSAGTSILAPPFEAQFRMLDAMNLGLDHEASSADIQHARAVQIGQVLALIPRQEVSEYLVTKFYAHPDWMYGCIDRHALLSEVRRYSDMCREGRQYEIDMLWVALYLMILSSALEGWLVRNDGQLDNSPFAGQSPKDLARRAQLWLAASQRALVLGNYTGPPRIRTIQTIILFGQYLQITGQCFSLDSTFWSMLSVAIRIALLLGLHKLGNNPEIMPPDDPAFPQGKNSVKRQSALRIFGTLCFLDWISASSPVRAYLLHPGQIDSEPPMNVDNSELSATNWQVFQRPLADLTDASYERIKLSVAKQLQRTHEKLMSPNRHRISYDTVLELDEQYRNILDEFPRAYQETEMSNSTSPAVNTSSVVQWNRNAALDSVHFRIMRLHRPFLASSYPRHKYSKDQCVRSARVVIRCLYNVRDVLTHVWHVYSHALGATIVLFFDLFEAIDNKATADRITAKKQTLYLASKIFQADRVASANLRYMVAQAGHALNALFAAVEQRLVLFDSHKSMPGHVSGMESFTQVLRTVSRDIEGSRRDPTTSVAAAPGLHQSHPPYNERTEPTNFEPSPESAPYGDQAVLQILLQDIGINEGGGLHDYWAASLTSPQSGAGSQSSMGSGYENHMSMVGTPSAVRPDPSGSFLEHYTGGW